MAETIIEQFPTLPSYLHLDKTNEDLVNRRIEIGTKIMKFKVFICIIRFFNIVIQLQTTNWYRSLHNKGDNIL